MSNTIYVLHRDEGTGPYDFSYYWSYESALRAARAKGWDNWGFQIIAVDEGTVD